MESRYLLYRVVPAFRNRIRQNYMLLSNSYSSITTVISEVSNSSPETTAAADDYVEMTDACIRRIKQLHNKETLSEGKMLRLSVEAGGCSGFQYVFQLDDKRNPDDMVFEKEGVKLIVDNISYDFVKGATVDYAEELIRSAFLVSRGLIGQGDLHNGLYILRHQHHQSFAAAASISKDDFFTWHCRLGHASSERVSFIFNNLNFVAKPISFHCFVCHLSKQVKLSFPNHGTRTSKLSDLVHMDVWGRYHVPTQGNQFFFLTLVEDFSRTTWVYFMHQKLDVPTLVEAVYLMVQTQFGASKKFRSDNGLEFLCSKIANFLSSKGACLQTNCPYTPQQNGVVERKHRHLLEVARALRFQSNVPEEFWGHCILHVAFLINRLSSPRPQIFI